MSFVSKLRPWQLGGLAAVLLVVVFGIYGVTTLFGGSDGSQEPVADAVVTQQQFPRQVQVSGRMVFPNTVELSFEAAGEVGEVLVVEGDRVEEGQVLASLDAVTVSALEQALAKAKFDLNEAQDALEESKEEFITTPLEQAEFEEKIAKARKDVEDAEDDLADYQRDYLADLAAAKKAKVAAEEVLDNALEDVSYYDRDQALSLAAARDDVSAKELALEKAKKNLVNFETNYQESLANAQLDKANAEISFDAAEAALNTFLFNPVANVEREESIDIEILRRLQSAYQEAETNLAQATEELADVKDNKELDRQKTTTAVAQAESDLAKAKDTLADLEDSIDQALVLEQRLAVVDAAEATLAQAKEDLAKEMEGSDQVELAIRENALKVAKEKLNDLLDGPDELDVAVKEAAVAAAQAKVDDALEAWEGAVVRAPFSGVVSLVNVEEDDKVTDQSRVLEVVDLSKVEVDGLVDAIDIAFVKEGDRSNVLIASMPGRKFEGVVVQVADEPRTDRGVVTYPVRIQIELPEGTEVPPGLSAVTSTITYQGGS